MTTTSILFLILSLFGASSVHAANDWSVPCVAGGCSWDTGDGKTNAFSSIAIGGSNILISDITPAAGWAISGCDPNWKDGSHTVQLQCTGNAKQTAHCSHVFEGGAEHTIVRLPENCGKGPFARVVSVKNQTNSNISPRASRHGNKLASTSTAHPANSTSPSPARPANSSSPSPAKSSPIGEAHTFTLDYDFKQIPSSRGKVTFAVTSTNLKGLPGVSKRDLDALRGRGRAGDLHRRNFGHLGVSQRGIGGFISHAADSVGNVVGDAADSVGNVVGHAADGVKNVVGDAASAVTSAAGSAASAIGHAVSNANTVNKNLSSGNIPVSFEKDVVLFNRSISCSPSSPGGGGVSGKAEFKVDVDGKLDATVSFGATIVGTIVPPQVSDFSVSADLGGTASATFNVDANAVGSLDSPAVSFFKTGLPGLSIPGVAALGPEFSINGQLTLDLKAEAQMSFRTAWDIPHVHLAFPPDKGSSTGTATVSKANNPLQLSVNPSLDVSASVGAHLIPRVDFGVDIFSGTVSASVFVDTDISVTLRADAKAQAQLQNSAAAAASTAATSITDNLAAPAATTFASRIATARTPTGSGGVSKKRSSSEMRQRAASSSVDECITLLGGISINGGLQGSLEPFIKQQQKVFNIFNKDVQLFQKCLNGGAAHRREVEVVRRAGGDGLQCPTNGVVSALKSLI